MLERDAGCLRGYARSGPERFPIGLDGAYGLDPVLQPVQRQYRFPQDCNVRRTVCRCSLSEQATRTYLQPNWTSDFRPSPARIRRSPIASTRSRGQKLSGEQFDSDLEVRVGLTSGVPECVSASSSHLAPVAPDHAGAIYERLKVYAWIESGLLPDRGWRCVLTCSVCQSIR